MMNFTVLWNSGDLPLQQEENFVIIDVCLPCNPPLGSVVTIHNPHLFDGTIQNGRYCRGVVTGHEFTSSSANMTFSLRGIK